MAVGKKGKAEEAVDGAENWGPCSTMGDVCQFDQWIMEMDASVFVYLL